MSCHYPNQAWRSQEVNKNGNRVPVFKEELGIGEMFYLPCGKCMGCRQNYMREWAIRCSHEAKLWPKNCFITLTYNEESIGRLGMLEYQEFDDFMARLRERKQFKNSTVRYYACGEYGGLRHRPHFHAILFNVDFDDREFWFMKDGRPVYKSELLSSIWEYKGNVTVQDFAFETARYVAGYVAKKWEAKEIYELGAACDPKYRIEFVYPPEKTMQSQSIGIPWLEKYWRDVFPGNGRAELILNGKPQKPPKAYVDWLRDNHPVDFEMLKDKRECNIDASQFVLKKNMDIARANHNARGSKRREFNEDEYMLRRWDAEEKCLMSKVKRFINERKR